MARSTSSAARGSVAGLAGAAALLLATAAHAGAIEDGNAGLEALNGGDYPRAITLFTHALNSGQLAGDDKQFAYANRGRAYLKQGDLSLAINDLDRARIARADDLDAQNDLVAALAAKLPVDAIPGLPKQDFWGKLGRSLLQGAVAGVVSGLQGDGQ